MSYSEKPDYWARQLVHELFTQNARCFGEWRALPIIGGQYLVGIDPIDKITELAVRALMARKWFAENGPPDAPPLPLSFDERERLKIGGLSHFVAWYARSLDSLEYDVELHPSFEDYVRGVLYAAEKRELVTLWFMDEATVDQLKKRFPPRLLKGLGPALCWKPPKRGRQKSLVRCH